MKMISPEFFTSLLDKSQTREAGVCPPEAERGKQV